MDIRNASPGRLIAEHPRASALSLAIVIAAILIARCFNAVFYPILFNEDGTQILALYTNNPDPGLIFRIYAGYVALLPNTLGYLVTVLFPLPVTPYVLVWLSLVCAVAALSLFALRRFRFVMPDDRARYAVCLLLALFPLGNHALTTSLTFSIWNIFLVALLLTVAPLPQSRAAGVAQFVFVGLAVFSHPFSIVFIPICLVLLRYRRTRADRLFHGGIAALAAAYFFVGIEPGPVGPRINLGTLVATFECLAQRVVFEPVLGNGTRLALNGSGHSPVNLLAICIVAAVVALVAHRWRRPGLENRTPVLVLIAFIMFTLTYISVVARTKLYEDFVSLAWAQRYFLIPQLLFLFVIVAHLVAPTDWSRLGRVPRSAALVFVLVFAWFLNVQHHPFFATSRQQSEQTMRFLRDARDRLNLDVPPDDGVRQMVLHRGADWDIKIDVENAGE
jgi:hypothetical protein